MRSALVDEKPRCEVDDFLSENQFSNFAKAFLINPGRAHRCQYLIFILKHDVSFSPISFQLVLAGSLGGDKNRYGVSGLIYSRYLATIIMAVVFD